MFKVTQRHELKTSVFESLNLYNDHLHIFSCSTVVKHSTHTTGQETVLPSTPTSLGEQQTCSSSYALFFSFIVQQTFHEEFVSLAEKLLTASFLSLFAGFLQMGCK